MDEVFVFVMGGVITHPMTLSHRMSLYYTVKTIPIADKV